MKQVNFSHPGGFPLEQETLERLQTAYRSELYEAIKAHLSIEKGKNYIIAHATDKTRGWAVIHEPTQTGEGILYPIKTGVTNNYLKTTKTTTNLTYGDGNSQTAYTDYEAEYVGDAGTPVTSDNEAVNYYDLKDFVIVKNLKSIEEILKAVGDNIDAIKANVTAVEGNIRSIETNINTIKQSYLPIDGSKAMQGDLNLGTHHLYLNNLNTGTTSDYLLAVNNQNQVVKSSTLLESLINRITILEDTPASTVPIGMIAIWGKPAPFPKGWEEYVPLRGRMPVGFDNYQAEFNQIDKYGGEKSKLLSIKEMPSHGHDWLYSYEGDDDNTGHSYDEFTFKPGKILQTDVKTPIGKTGGDQPFSILNPYRVVHFIEYTGCTSDLTAPTIPTNLIASKIGTKNITLTWNASTDDVGVTNYQVFKDGVLLKEIGNTLSYDITGLSTGTFYNFSVKAKDAAGNLSAAANVSATTIAADLIAPTVPLYLHAYTQGQGLIGLEWGTSTDNDGPITYELWRKIDGVAYFLFQTTNNTFSSDSGLANSTYSYKVRAIDPSGNMSAFTPEATITISSL
jgi:chitodextrinase